MSAAQQRLRIPAGESRAPLKSGYDSANRFCIDQTTWDTRPIA